MSIFTDSIEFVTEECCSCGVPFAMTADFRKRRLNDQENFYCPAGHSMHYTGKTVEQKLKERLDQEQRARHDAQREAAELRQRNKKITKAHYRMRERVKNGVCPCCNRTFQNLLNHMQKQHPDFGNEKQLRTIREIYGLTQADLAGELGIQQGHVSMYENGRPHVPEYAKGLLDGWLLAEAA